MNSHIEQGGRQKPKLKMIVLGSGYNPLQEGSDTYIVEKMSKKQQDCYYGRLSGRESYYPEHSFFESCRLYVHVEQESKAWDYVTLSSGGQVKRGQIQDSEVPDFQVSDFHSLNLSEQQQLSEHLLSIAKTHGALDKNPFTTLAREAGYDIEIESVSLGDPSQAACWTDSPDGVTDWGRVIRTQIELPSSHVMEYSAESKQKLATLEQRWESETHQYAGVLIINGSGDGRFFEQYFKNLYSKYEELYDARPQGTEVYFADWCTCCTAPKMIDVAENPPGPYCRDIGTDPLQYSSKLKRTRGSETLHGDFKQWLDQIGSAALQRQEIRKNFSDAMNELRAHNEPSSSTNKPQE